jgi:hypothetical protein
MAMGNGPFIDGLPIKNGSYINISTSAPRKFFPPRCAPWVTTAGSRSPPRRASRCRCRPRTVRRPPTCRRMRRRGSRGWVGWLKVRTAVKVGFFDIPNSSNPHEITMNPHDSLLCNISPGGEMVATSSSVESKYRSLGAREVPRT